MSGAYSCCLHMWFHCSTGIGGIQERIKDAIEKIRLNKQLPYLVGSVVEVRLAISGRNLLL